MIIYSTRVWLKCGFDKAWGIAADWLAYKFKQDASTMGFERDNQHRNGRMLAEWLVMREAQFSIAASRLTHGDSTVEGRTWITDIGVRDAENKPGLVECSVTLRTMENSPMVASRPETTRPMIVKQWIEQGDPAEITPGWQITPLHNQNAKLFLQWIESPQRVHPILLLSPQVNGAMIIRPEDAWFMLAGLSDVVRIQHGHGDAVKQVLGERYAAWNGAARIIYAPTYRDGRRFIHVERLTMDDLMLMSVQEDEKHGRDLLELIAHRVNSVNSWHQVVLETVKDQRSRNEILRRQRDSEAAELLLNEAAQQEAKLEQLKVDLSERDQTITDLQEQLRHKQNELKGLRLAQDFQRAGRHKVETRLMELRPLFINAVEDDATLEEILRLIEAFFPERVVVLPSAYVSASESAAFEYRQEAFKLILKLVTGYWDAMINGGDVRAREVFGKNEYSAKESETVERNQRARRLRTFEYKEENIEMMRHLKHGVTDNVEDTLRVHFHWDSEDRKIVIGHCGRHLDFS